MRMNKFLLFSLCAVLFSATSVYAQHITGKVVDAETAEPLAGVSIVIKGTTTGAMTDLDGSFAISAAAAQTLVVTYIGYITREVTASEASVIELSPSSVTLNDVVVSSQMAISRKTPVAASNISFDFINERLGNSEFPEILKSTPGIFATKKGGGWGDSEMRMRGFTSPNVAVMVNGIPMNDMEWGGTYWSNWQGLSDVTLLTQTQRGLGASKVSAPSVGGTINVITKSIDAQKGGTASYTTGNDGYTKMLFAVSSGMMKNGWAFTVLGAHTYGNGYVQGTDFDGYNYFVNVAKKLGANHTLSFTAFGAPQKHYQRNYNDYLTIAQWQAVKNYMNGDSPYKYNPTYGFDSNGQRKTSQYNEYHKPQISLNWNWAIDQKSSLSTVLYTSIGRGNGYSGQGYTAADRSAWFGASYGTLNNTFRNPDGTFAYAQIEANNAASDHGSLMVMSKNPNFHNWYGLVSTYTTNFANMIDFYGGIDLRYYKGVHQNVISDLYGGQYFIDSDSRKNVLVANNEAAADPNWKNQKLQVGDVVYRDYDGYVMQEGAFAQAEGTFLDKALNAFVSGSLSNTGYWRYDRLYYDAEHARSKTINFIGFTVKGGVNYNFATSHNIFANIGYISRAPFFSGGAFLQSTTSNDVNPNAVNEKIFSAEAGYGFYWKYASVRINAYYTKWMDKTMSKSGDPTPDGDIPRINMQGVNARHMGVEVEVKSTPLRWIEFTGMLSLGNWQWDSDATGTWFSSSGQPLAYDGKTFYPVENIDEAAVSKISLKGIKVGGAPQTTFDISVTVKPIQDVRVGAELNGMARMFADYTFTGSNLQPNGTYIVSPTWKVPSAATVDLFASYGFKIAGLRTTFSGTCNNLFNQIYIADATDGTDHDWQTARVFYGFGRTWTATLKLNF